MGYDVLGLELSRTAAGHARDVLGLPVAEQPLETFAAATTERFDVIVLADVIEHLEDPAAALDACARLLADGGVLCVITPDPVGAAGACGGRALVGLRPRPHLPAAGPHAARAADGARAGDLRRRGARALVRAALLARRARRSAAAARAPRCAGSPRRGSATAASRSRSATSASCWRTASPCASRPRRSSRTAAGRSASPSCCRPTARPRRSPPSRPRCRSAVVDRALLVDDASPDTTPEVALREGFELLRLPANRGYGGNQKAGYVRALLDGADIVVMVHADNQYDPSLIERMVRPLEAGIADVVMGSRLLEDETIAGGMPRWKWLGNRALTAVENLAFRRGFSEYHTGYRAYSAEFLRRVAFLRNSDDFVFDQEMFAQIVASRSHVVELPIPTRYFLEASSVSFRASVRYGLKTLWVLVRFRLHQRGRRWAVLEPPAAPLGAPIERDAAARG